ncbi:MAG: hypothetical protein QX196_03600 [Methylococcaceae bacterium]
MTKCLPQADYMKLTVFHFVKRLLLTYLPSFTRGFKKDTKAGYAKNILLTGMGGFVEDSGNGFYQSPRSLFLLKQGIPAEALLFDGLSINTHQETLNLATLLRDVHEIT